MPLPWTLSFATNCSKSSVQPVRRLILHSGYCPPATASSMIRQTRCRSRPCLSNRQDGCILLVHDWAYSLHKYLRALGKCFKVGLVTPIHFLSFQLLLHRICAPRHFPWNALMRIAIFPCLKNTHSFLISSFSIGQKRHARLPG